MNDPYPRYRSHYRPRTTEGRFAAWAFVLVFALCQPPVVHMLVNRIEPTLLGLPFLYVWLLGVYTLLIVILVWALRKGV